MSGKSLNIGRYLLVGAALACIAHPAEGRTSLGASGVRHIDTVSSTPGGATAGGMLRLGRAPA
ncbi:hypothetical protein ASE17_06555 [Phenylobacterium sp. Root77]|uniref:hypothetical protein n=1 Tax=unclassified Phenylobacterium TaxID=2640670 RepID=UPI0006FD2816|nr:MULTISPECIES: hypothetical protein [unclassified Phenylobacterium]KQW68116.1 hypothetical protein ASC73_16460 [Phenylobacterium sp. Root1277]KQW91859.1 hypothetical protein ASC79_09835 [Phenylobacterium sp. Root1290]KRC40090.1 hypothetical protein ASE17_06555 [Phenylobacterium sp. Root77]